MEENHANTTISNTHVNMRLHGWEEKQPDWSWYETQHQAKSEKEPENQWIHERDIPWEEICKHDLFECIQRDAYREFAHLFRQMFKPELPKDNCQCCDCISFGFFDTQCQETNTKDILTLFSLRNNHDQTVLHLACEWGAFKTFDWLLHGFIPTHGICMKEDCVFRSFVCSMDDMERNALHIATKHGHIDMVQQLLAFGWLDINAMDWNHFTALHFACQRGDNALIELLVLHHDDPMYPCQLNAKSRWDESTPLHWLCEHGDVSLMSAFLLLSHGADPNARDVWGKTPLHWIMRPNFVSSSSSSSSSTRRMDTIQHRHDFHEAFDYYSCCDEKEHDDEQELIKHNQKWIIDHISCILQHGENLGVLLIQLLCHFGANVNHSDHLGRTPFHWACKLQKDKIAYILLENGANLSQRDHDDKIALDYCSMDLHDHLLRPDHSCKHNLHKKSYFDGFVSALSLMPQNNEKKEKTTTVETRNKKNVRFGSFLQLFKWITIRTYLHCIQKQQQQQEEEHEEEESKNKKEFLSTNHDVLMYCKETRIIASKKAFLTCIAMCVNALESRIVWTHDVMYDMFVDASMLRTLLEGLEGARYSMSSAQTSDMLCVLQSSAMVSCTKKWKQRLLHPIMSHHNLISYHCTPHGWYFLEEYLAWKDTHAKDMEHALWYFQQYSCGTYFDQLPPELLDLIIQYLDKGPRLFWQ